MAVAEMLAGTLMQRVSGPTLATGLLVLSQTEIGSDVIIRNHCHKIIK